MALPAALLVGCGPEPPPLAPPFTDTEAGLTGVMNCSVAWGDYDSDGDLDLALAGYAVGVGSVSKIYQNEGGTFAEIGAGLTGLGWCSLAWGDCDSDGDIDLALAGRMDGGMRASELWRNDSGTFNKEAAASLMNLDLCALTWGDCDNDGDLDLALAGWDGTGPVSKVYANAGLGVFSDTSAALTDVWQCSLAWGDYDNDGDLDIAAAGLYEDVADSFPDSSVYRNDGGTLVDTVAGLTGLAWSSLAWGDHDNDGDLDLAVAGSLWDGAEYVPTSKLYRNEGGGVFTDMVAGLIGVSSCSLAWGDYDNDGDLDIALAGDDSANVPVSKVYRNDDGVFVDIGAELAGVRMCSLAWGDCDNDGDLDLALAGYDGDKCVSKIYRNNISLQNAPPTAPCALASSMLGNYVILSWNAATDAETPMAGLSYNLYVRTPSGEQDVMPGMADPATGYRRIPALGNAQKRCFWILKGLAPGTYYWSVQAIDTAYASGPWASEEMVTVP